MEEVVFTSAGLLDLLSQINELSEYDIDLNDNNGDITLTIGDSIYSIAKPDEAIEVPEEVVEEVSEIAESAISDVPTTVESGIIKEALKTLLVGGAVRLVAKMLKGKD